MEVHAYVKNGKYCVVNNTYEPQKTVVYRGDGSSFTLHMKANEIKKLSPSELDAKLLELKDELFKLRFQQAINQLDNPMRISAVKKDIARVKTVIRDIELHGNEG